MWDNITSNSEFTSEVQNNLEVYLAKVTKVYENYTMDWRITSITESKIDEVIE